MVAFVMTGEFKADSTMVYGIFPPLMVSPQGWHVVSVSVTFGCTDAGAVAGAAGRQDVSLPAMMSVSLSRAFVDEVTHRSW